MEYRQLGASGLKVSVLSFGTATFGSGNNFFRRWGATDVKEAKRLIDVCQEAGVNLFDTADGKNLVAAEWNLSIELIKKPDDASKITPIYPYWHQRAIFAERNPPPTE